MTRAPRLSAADRRRHLKDWRALAEASLAAACGVEGVDLKALGDDASSARSVWAWPIAWPNGLAFEVLAVTARAYARSGSMTFRARLTGPLAGAARAVLDALADLEAARSEPGSLSALEGA